MELRGEPGSIRERTVIERQVLHVVRLVDDLLDVSRLTRGKVVLEKKTVAVSAVIADAIELASPLLEQRKQRLITEAGPRSLVVEADPFRLAQAIANLLTNAAKFTDAGGTINVSARLEGEQVVVRVKDTGIGIEADLLPRVFDAFAQCLQPSDRTQGGLGLGLTIVKSLVGLHGGEVEAHSAGRGQGSEFVVRLPALKALAAVASPARPALDPARAPAGLRVLVVDDNEDAAMLLGELLRMKGYEVVIVHDGAAALEARKTFVPDVGLLDIGLPVMDGHELARQLRARYPLQPLRLIAITGYNEAKDRLRSKEAGFDAHLAKPADFDEVCALLAPA